MLETDGMSGRSRRLQAIKRKSYWTSKISQIGCSLYNTSYHVQKFILYCLMITYFATSTPDRLRSQKWNPHSSRVGFQTRVSYGKIAVWKIIYIYIYIKWADRNMTIYVFNFPTELDYIFKMPVLYICRFCMIHFLVVTRKLLKKKCLKYIRC